MADEILGTVATTSVLTPNGTAGSSSIDTAGDQDWWKVELTAGKAYTFRLNKGTGSTLDAHLRLLDASGNPLKIDDNSGGSGNAMIGFTPAATGTYYLSAEGKEASTGAYAVSVAADTVPDTTATTSALTLNGTAASGSIEAGGDKDWWKVDLAAGTTYSFRLSKTGSSALDPHLRLLDAAGNQIKLDDNGGGSGNALITYTATAAGTYYLAAQGAGDSFGNYTLAATNDVIPASSQTTSTLATNGTAGSSSIDTAGDQDWWKVDLKAGYTYTLRLNGASGSPLDASLRLLDSTGRQLKANDDNGSSSNSLIAFTPKADGTFYLAAQGYKGSTGGYSITATADAILATTATTSALALNGTASSGSIEANGDRDWWSVDLTAGTTYTFRLDKSTFSSLDTCLRLLDSTGKQVKANDDGGSGYNSLILFTPETTGKYFLSAQGYKHSTGGYWLTGSHDATPAATSSSAALTLNGAAAAGAIDTTGDQDWWKAELTAGTTYTFRLNRTSTSELDAYLRLLDSSGQPILVNDNGDGSNALITYTPTASGSYFLSAQGARKSSGAYALTGTFDIVPASTATGSTVTVGGAAGSGTIDTAADQDWWKVSLTAGTAYTFSLNKSATSLDPYLRLLDGSGTELKVDDNSGSSGNALITYTPTSSGTYLLSAQGAGGSSGAYSLSATAATATATGDATTLDADTASLLGSDTLATLVGQSAGTGEIL